MSLTKSLAVVDERGAASHDARIDALHQPHRRPLAEQSVKLWPEQVAHRRAPRAWRRQRVRRHRGTRFAARRRRENVDDAGDRSTAKAAVGLADVVVHVADRHARLAHVVDEHECTYVARHAVVAAAVNNGDFLLHCGVVMALDHCANELRLARDVDVRAAILDTTLHEELAVYRKRADS